MFLTWFGRTDNIYIYILEGRRIDYTWGMPSNFCSNVVPVHGYATSLLVHRRRSLFSFEKHKSYGTLFEKNKNCHKTMKKRIGVKILLAYNIGLCTEGVGP